MPRQRRIWRLGTTLGIGGRNSNTPTILLAALSDLLADGQLLGGLKKSSVNRGNAIMGPHPRPRLMLRSRDDAFFKTHEQEQGAITDLAGTAVQPRNDAYPALAEFQDVTGADVHGFTPRTISHAAGSLSRLKAGAGPR